jgi:hypothetical protein
MLGTSRPGFGSSDRLEIPPERETVWWTDFSAFRSVREVIFGLNSRCRRIEGFNDFPRLSRITIPSAVEVIGVNGFCDCPSLIEVNFESGSHLKKITGFRGWTSLCRIIIPSSVEEIFVCLFRVRVAGGSDF